MICDFNVGFENLEKCQLIFDKLIIFVLRLRRFLESRFINLLRSWSILDRYMDKFNKV